MSNGNFVALKQLSTVMAIPREIIESNESNESNTDNWNEDWDIWDGSQDSEVFIRLLLCLPGELSRYVGKDYFTPLKAMQA